MGSRVRYRFPWSTYPAVRMVLLFASGILAAAYIPAGRHFLFFGFSCYLLLWIFLERWSRKSLTVGTSLLAGSGYLIVILMLGIIRYDFHQATIERNLAVTKKISLYAWEEIQIEGEITDMFTTTAGKTAVNVRVRRSILDQKPWCETYMIRLYSGDDHPELSRASPGDSLTSVVRLFDLSSPVNPGEFDYRGHLRRQGIYLHGEIAGALTLEEISRGVNWYGLKQIVHNRIEFLFDERTVPLAKAVLTGSRKEIHKDDQKSFSRAGLSHIMAVSGMHVGFVIFPFLLLIPWLLQIRMGEWLVAVMVTVILLLYAGISGFSPSASRASLMAWLLVAGRMKRWKRDPLNLMGGSAFLLLMMDPMQLFDIGFQLSYIAVFTILLVLPVLRSLIPEKLRYTIRGKLILVLLVSFSVQWCLYPVIGWYFGEFSIMGPLANVLVFPVLTVIVPFSLFLIAIAENLPELLLLLNTVNAYGFDWIAHVGSAIGGWHRSWVNVHLESFWIFILWVMMIGLAATVRIPSMRVIWCMAMLAILVVISGGRVAEKFSPSEMTVVMLDVGQGDAIHIETPEGRHLLIDTGKWSPARNSGERVLIPYLQSRGVDRLDAVILTHPHADHIGGVPALLEKVKIDTLYYSGFEHNSRLYKTYQKEALKIGVPLKAVKKGDQLEFDTALRIFVVGPDGEIHNSNPNDHSVVLKLVYHKSHFLFTGDAQHHQEERMIRRYGDFLQSEFLKMGHHGSRTSSTSEFLSVVRPEKAAASLSFSNRYGHPHTEAVDRVRQFTENIYFTSLEGALIIRSDGENIFRER